SREIHSEDGFRESKARIWCGRGRVRVAFSETFVCESVPEHLSSGRSLDFSPLLSEPHPARLRRPQRAPFLASGGPSGYAGAGTRSVTRRSQGPYHTSNGAGTMPRMPLRPFRLSDALLLVAATALGLALCRLLNAHSQVEWRDVWNAFRSRDAANLSLA